jgi:hypothetical protein
VFQAYQDILVLIYTRMEMDTLDHLLMPPPPPISKKRPRSITIYSEEEAYAIPYDSRSRPICTRSYKSQHQVQCLNSDSSDTWVTPSPRYNNTTTGQNRRALRSLQPKSLACHMTGEEEELQSPNDTEVDVDAILSSALNENSNDMEPMETLHFTAIVSKSMNSPTMNENRNDLSRSCPEYSHHKSIDFSTTDKNNTSTLYEQDSPKDTSTELCESPKITTRFHHIIGHGAAKLRLEEAILPLALPSSLVHSVMRGMFFLSFW